MKTKISIAAVLMLGAAACKQQDPSDQQQPSPAHRVEQAQKDSEHAYDQAKQAQEKARKQSEQARKSEDQARQKQNEAEQAQQKAQQQAQAAQNAQQQAQQAGQQASQQARTAQERALQGEQQAAQQEPAQPVASASATGTVTTARGTVQRASPSEVVVEQQGSPQLSVRIDPWKTTITKNGATGSASDIQQGATVSVQYRMVNNQAVAQSVDVRSQGG